MSQSIVIGYFYGFHNSYAKVLKATVSFAGTGTDTGWLEVLKYKSQVKINSQPKRVTTGSYSGMHFKTQAGIIVEDTFLT